ncbi:hypothetical protein CYLTODRAFT_489563 [Cylindrobasidium torrendii FP15055 ss-10]|uniref:Uncharacterized protein n=1 Tax=Cylindrobasidium torrendii FP15055 ss-10 TaxID=1314674 RepID=A0A0D7BEY8_9AGAR|nr:hypothetical protein CYLTODRAFT_489563 [Cylindrobasidium torrendii FP15055 ss-10]
MLRWGVRGLRFSGTDNPARQRVPVRSHIPAAAGLKIPSRVISPNTVQESPKTAYRNCKGAQHGVPPSLEKQEFGRLLQLYGSKASRMDKNALTRIHSGELWSFVLELGRDMERLWGSEAMDGQDKVWLLRALLTKSSTKHGVFTNRLYDALKSDLEPSVHLQMLSWTSKNKPARLVTRLVDVLSYSDSPPTEDLWPYILSAREHHAFILDAFFRRIRLPANEGGAPRLPSRVHDSIGHVYHPSILTVDYLSAALCSTVFPHVRVTVPRSLQTWAKETALQSFHPSVPATQRWPNLVCMALVDAPPDVASKVTPPIGEWNAETVVWRTVLVLSTVRRFFQNTKTPTLGPLLRSIWRQYEATIAWEGGGEAQRFLDRAVAMAILNLATQADDSLLLDQVKTFIDSRRLWDSSCKMSKREHLQLEALVTEYLFTSMYFKRFKTSDMLSFFRDTDVHPYRESVMDAFVRRIMTKDVELARQLLLRCSTSGIRLSPDTFAALCLLLAASNPAAAIGLAHIGHLSTFQTTRVACAVLLSLHRGRVSRLPIGVSSNLLRLLESAPVAWTMEKPFHHALRIIARSGHPDAAIGLLEKTQRDAGKILPTPSAIRLLRVILRYGTPRLVKRIWNLSGKDKELRAVAVTGLAYRGASRMARSIYRQGHGDSARTRILQHVGFKIRGLSRFDTGRLASIDFLSALDLPAVTLALRLLSRSRRPFAAMKLYAQVHPKVSSPAQTYLGNIILGRSLVMRRTRNARLVRRILCDHEYLVQRFGFEADLVTANIIIAAVLRWREVNARELFCWAARVLNYHYGGLFGERESMSCPVPLLRGRFPEYVGLLESNWERNRKPFLRMFVKTFYERGDRFAATRVLTLLKERHTPQARLLGSTH